MMPFSKVFKVFRCGFFTALVTLAATIPVSAQTITGITNSTGGYAWFGQAGDMVTIYGTAFAYPTAVVEVRFNGVPVTQGGVISDSTIGVRIPGGATTGYVSARKSGGNYVYSTQPFTVIGAGPYVSGFSPTSGTEGTVVTLRGAHFTGVHTVKFGDLSVSATPITDVQLQVSVPHGVATGPLSVISSAGTFVTSSNFYAPPVITGFTPASGRPGTNVVITGVNFLDVTGVSFGGTAALSFTADSNTQITASVPAGTATGIILITTPGGLDFTSSNFVIRPAINNFSPASGPEGTVVTIAGANLTDKSGSAPTVRFNGVAHTVASHSFSQILVSAPASSSGPITVTTADGTATSSSVFYYPPVITGFTPNAAASGSQVTISGNSFTNASMILFNGLPATDFGVSNNIMIVATVPVGVTTGSITVTAPGGTTNSDAVFYAAPVISSFSPASGGAGTNVTVYGNNFQGVSSVKFNGKAATAITNVTASQLTATAPPGVSTGPISVTGPAGTAVSSQSFVVPAYADVYIYDLVQSPNPVGVGELLTNTISPVNNIGPNTASNVVVLVTLGPGMIVQSATATRGTINTNGNPVVFSLGSMSTGDYPTLKLVVQPTQTGSITTTATISSDVADPNPGNNTKSSVVTVLPVPVLDISVPQANRVRLLWPVELTNYTLQYTPALINGPAWNNVSTAPDILGDKRAVTETSSQTKRFYRLKKN